MRHWLIQPTWRCQNSCAYCWLNHTIRERPELYHAEERPLGDWVAAIKRDTPDGVDIAGGEPFLVEWIPELIWACPDISFGLSTNGLVIDEIRRLANGPTKNISGVNVSYHPDCLDRIGPDYNRMWREAVEVFHSAGIPIGPSLVDYRDNLERSQEARDWLKTKNINCAITPYERMDTLSKCLDQGLCCKGGINHLTVAPDGTAWPCLTTLRSPYWRETQIGNWLDNTVKPSLVNQPCYLNCVDYYVLPSQHPSGDMWGLEAYPCG